MDSIIEAVNEPDASTRYLNNWRATLADIATTRVPRGAWYRASTSNIFTGQQTKHIAPRSLQHSWQSVDQLPK